jgi:hypothetical protein
MEHGKICTKCGKWKILDEFYKQATGKYGRTSKCKKCDNSRKTPRTERKCMQCNNIFIGTPKKKWCSEECKKKYNNKKRVLKHSFIIKRKKLIIDENGRQCRKCEIYKTWENFWKHGGMKSGYEPCCIECKKDKYNPELNRIKGKIYRQSNPKKEMERFRRYRQTERGKESEYKKRMKRRSYKHNVKFSEHQRNDILNRDNYTCQCCHKRGGNINAHHLDGYDWCKEKRTDVNNAVTLCQDCHSDFHHQYGYGGNTKEQFEEWINNN